MIIFSFISFATACLSASSSRVNSTNVDVPSSETILPLYISFDITRCLKLSNCACVEGKLYSSISLPISIPQSLPLISITSVRLVTVEIPSIYLTVSVTCFISSNTLVSNILSACIITIPIVFPPYLLPISVYKTAVGSSSGNEFTTSASISISLI